MESTVEEINLFQGHTPIYRALPEPRSSAGVKGGSYPNYRSTLQAVKVRISNYELLKRAGRRA
jgi:hypothetical protein